MHISTTLTISCCIFSVLLFAFDGEPDLSFGDHGRVITDFFHKTDVANHLLIDKDGSLDESFGLFGKQIIPFKNTCHWEAVALDADQEIIVGGYVWNGQHYDMALMRFLNEYR